MHARAFLVTLALLPLAACDRVIAIEGLDGARGPAGPVGAPGTPGPRGEDAAQAGARLRPEWLVTDDGARAWAGSWRDTARGESCTFVEVDGERRCLPVHRTQQELPAFASPTCDGARASKVYEPGYIRETATGSIFKLGAPIAEAWGVDGAGACISLGAGAWYAWEAVSIEAFVGADVTAD